MRPHERVERHVEHQHGDNHQTGNQSCSLAACNKDRRAEDYQNEKRFQQQQASLPPQHVGGSHGEFGNVLMVYPAEVINRI